MADYDILYCASTPEVFFSEFVRKNQRIINNIFYKHFFHKVFFCEERLKDLIQEGLIYAWNDLPKTPEQYRKFKAINISWITWFYNNLRWGASQYLFKLHSKTNVREYSTDVQKSYDFVVDTLEGRFSSQEYEGKLSAIDIAKCALPKQERKMIDLWLKYGSVVEATRSLNMSKFEGMYKYNCIFEILKNDIEKLHSGKPIFKCIDISFIEALKVGFEHVRDSLISLQIRNGHAQYQALKRYVLNQNLGELHLSSIDADVCERVCNESFLPDDSPSSKVKRVSLFRHIMQSLVELNFIRFNPALTKGKYGFSGKIQRRTNASGRDFQMVYLPEKEFKSLTELCTPGNQTMTASTIGINRNNLARLLKSRYTTVRTALKVLEFLHALALTDKISTDGFQEFKKGGDLRRFKSVA